MPAVSRADVLAFIRTATRDDIDAMSAQMKARCRAIEATAQSQLGIGDTVEFESKRGGTVRGTVKGFRGKNVEVWEIGVTTLTLGGKWRVSPSLLKRVPR